MDQLQERIQTAVGWTNSHLHMFQIGRENYGDPEALHDGFDDFAGNDSTTTRLSEILSRDGKRFTFGYEYEFGDDWQHKIEVKGCQPAKPNQKCPRCTAGKLAWPPKTWAAFGATRNFWIPWTPQTMSGIMNSLNGSVHSTPTPSMQTPPQKPCRRAFLCGGSKIWL